MKPYLESIRKLSRVGLILFALSIVANAVISIQYCTVQYHSNVPNMTSMFMPLIAFIYAGGVVLALEGFSFLNKRSDSDFYHSLPVSRAKLFWAITLAAFTWIAATVLGSVLMTVIVFTLTKTSFVQLYALVAVPFFTIATLMVFAATAIAMNLTGTAITGLGLTVLVFGLLRFVQFTIARGIVANAQIIGWLDLPWYLTPVTNIATGQIAQLLRPMLRQTLYAPVNMIYSAAIAVGELFLAQLLFKKRHSELAEHGATSAAVQTVFACAAVIPVVMLFSSGIIREKNPSLPIVVGIAVGIYVIYQIVVLRTAKKVLRTLPWLLVPIAIGAAGYFGTMGTASAMQTYVPNTQDVAYVQFPGVSRGSESISYQQYEVSKVKFTETDVRQYAVETLRDNIANIRRLGYINYNYDAQAGYLLINQPVTFVLKNGAKFSRMLTFLNQNTLLTYCQENEDFMKAISTLPPQDSVRYLQGASPYQKGYAESNKVLEAFYSELSTTSYPASDSYRYYDPNAQYTTNEDQNFGSLTISGYIGMVRYWDDYNIRLGMPKTASAWMEYQNGMSQGEHLDVLQQMTVKSETLQDDMDYFNLSTIVYNVPMSDGTKQTLSFYFDRSPYDNTTDMKDQLQPLVNEFVSILQRSKPTTNPTDLCTLVSWGGRMHNDDGTYIGADVIAQQPATNSDGSFVSGGSIYYVSDGRVISGGSIGAINAYNPCFRAFSEADQARLIEIFQQWKALQDQYNYTVYGSKPIDGPSIGTGPIPTPQAGDQPVG